MELYIRTEGYDLEVLTKDFTSHGITVPKGFQFDGASTPRALWSLVPPYKRTKKSACIHDWNCRNAKNDKDRLDADKLFRRMLLEAGYSRMRAWLAYRGVRAGAKMGIGIYYKD